LELKWAWSTLGKRSCWPPRPSPEIWTQYDKPFQSYWIYSKWLFGEKVGQFTTSFPTPCCFSISKRTRQPQISPSESWRKDKSQHFFQPWSISQTGSRHFPENCRYTSSDIGCALPETENRKWKRHSHLPQWRHQNDTFRKEIEKPPFSNLDISVSFNDIRTLLPPTVTSPSWHLSQKNRKLSNSDLDIRTTLMRDDIIADCWLSETFLQHREIIRQFFAKHCNLNWLPLSV